MVTVQEIFLIEMWGKGENNLLSGYSMAGIAVKWVPCGKDHI